MIHFVFNRPTQTLKVFYRGVQRYVLEASGSAWGDGGPNAPYGFECQIEPGHYLLTGLQRFDPIPAEGAGQINVSDMTPRDVSVLAIANKAKWIGGAVFIGGITLPIGGLAKYGRSAVMIHAGGTNLGEPACFAPDQPLCKTLGCTRCHNRDLATLLDFLSPVFAGQTDHVVFSVIGDSPALPQ